jgi:acyl dehydratase
MTVSSISQKAICHLGWDKVRFTEPVFVGDTLYAETEILSRRNSKSRPGQGILIVSTQGTNQRGETVVSFERTILLASRNNQ